MERKLTQEVALSQIEQVLRRGQPSDPPAYTLVLGAGASFGSVPTAKQMIGIPTDRNIVHPQSIPLFLHHLETGQSVSPNDYKVVIREFWESFARTNPALIHKPELGERPPTLISLQEGLPSPDSVAAAYMALFAQNRAGGINTAEGARSYLRSITLPKSGQIRLNGTHFFLASLLSLQTRHGEIGARDQPLYIGKRPFARTLFTTNFDPLLQVSLQLFQLLYYMTDRPELLTADALHTDDHPAIHLFYAHGSVHRPFLANNDNEIGHLRERNAQSLAGYLGHHGVIVLGYSGWDDCLLRALNQTSSFANNLYWLARSEDSLSPEVQRFLSSRPNAYWVQIDDGGQWMAALHRQLCPGMPFTELLKNPIPFLRRRLEQVSLDSITLESVSLSTISASDATSSPSAASEQITPEKFRLQVIKLLETAEFQFELSTDSNESATQLATLEHQADLAYGGNDWAGARDLYSRIIEASLAPAAAPTRALAFFRRGYCLGQLGEPAKEISDYSAAIALPGVTTELVAIALINRGITYGQLGDFAKEIADYSAVVSLTGAPARQVADALLNRGVIQGKLGDSSKALADYSAVLSLPGAPVEQVATALFNRGIRFGYLGNSAKEVADYSAVISLPGAPAEQVAKAHINRGAAHSQLGDFTNALADYSAVISLPGAPAEQVAKAHINRGVRFGHLGDPTKEIADYSAVISLPGAPSDQVARALINRGSVHSQLGDSANAIADYSAAVSLPGAPSEQVARALISRGVTHTKIGDPLKALADYSAVISLPGAPTEQVARALINRGAAHSKLGDSTKALADYSAAVSLPGAPTEQVAKALYNRGLRYGHLGDSAKAIADYSAVISLDGASVDQVAKAKRALKEMEGHGNGPPPTSS